MHRLPVARNTTSQGHVHSEDRLKGAYPLSADTTKSNILASSFPPLSRPDTGRAIGKSRETFQTMQQLMQHQPCCEGWEVDMDLAAVAVAVPLRKEHLQGN